MTISKKLVILYNLTWLNIRTIAEIVGIDKAPIQQILPNNFNKQNVCVETIPKILTFE